MSFSAAVLRAYPCRQRSLSSFCHPPSIFPKRYVAQFQYTRGWRSAERNWTAECKSMQSRCFPKHPMFAKRVVRQHRVTSKNITAPVRQVTEGPQEQFVAHKWVKQSCRAVPIMHCRAANLKELVGAATNRHDLCIFFFLPCVLLLSADYHYCPGQPCHC